MVHNPHPFRITKLTSWEVDAGKSTMLGVLVKGGLDDGRGKARVNLFRHKHEVESGRTSSVGMEIMGFDVHGDVVGSSIPGRKLSWEEIGKRSVYLSNIAAELARLILAGESDQLHGSCRSRAIFANHCIWPAQ